MNLKKLIFATMLAAISVIINVLFKSIIALDTIGTAFYAIPIIIACIYLDFKYSVLVALASDILGVLLSPFPFYIFFTLSSLMWGIIPSLLKGKKQSLFKLIIIIFITHIFATTINSFAIAFHITKSFKAMLIDLPLRLILIIPNTLILAFLTEAISEAIGLTESFLTTGEE